MVSSGKDLAGPRRKVPVRPVLSLLALLVFLALLLAGSGRGTLVINELMASNRGTIADEDGEYPDWLELYNSGASSLDLSGFWLSDDPTLPLKWEIPSLALPAHGYLLIFASGKDRRDPDGPFLHTNFRLSAREGTLLVSTKDGGIVDRVEAGGMLANVSFGRNLKRPGQWVYYLDPTPGEKNTTRGFARLERPVAEDASVYINEFLAASRTSLVDEDGDLSDWIEFYNSGDGPRRLEGYWLSDKADNPFLWRFPDVVIEPGEYLVVFASGKDRRDAGGQLHANFRLNDRTDNLVFSAAEGQVIEDLEIRDMITDVSYGQQEGSRGNWLYFPRPTPGEANDTEGFEELSGELLKQGSGLRMNEAMALGRSTLADEDGDYSDWIEIFNSGGASVDLAGYGLTDRRADPYRWVFPQVTLGPQGFLVVFASGKDRRVAGGRLHTNFRIGITGETLVLSNPWGRVVDTLATGRLEPDMSAGGYPDGGQDRFFFPKPSPGFPNMTPALAGYAPQPVFSLQSGFFDGPQSLVMATGTQRPGAVIRYTVDGAEPSGSSSLYSGPIPIEATTVVRAKTFVTGLLPSVTANRSFFIAERSTLMVVSILMDPADLMDPNRGIYSLGYSAAPESPHLGANYWRDVEKPVHLQFFEPSGRLGFSQDLGIKIGGQYSRAMPQKAFNVFARDSYGSSVMEYPFFPGLDLTTFKAITLRTSGQDAGISKMRDILMTSLLSETDLDCQHYRPAVVYINGAYWGIYEIRERINEYFIAYSHDLDPGKVDLLQANWDVRAGNNDHYLATRDFVRRNDMRRQENYDYVKTQMDVKNYMDYLVAQTYCANIDLANVRFWRERTEGALWRWIVYDTDGGFYRANDNTLASLTDPKGTGWAQRLSTLLTTKLLQNTEFRQQLLERFAYHLNYTFARERVVGRIDEIAATLEPEMPRHLQRWGGGSMEDWRIEVRKLRVFAEKRPAIVLGHIQSEFGLSDEEMAIFDAGGGG